uniref:ADP-ribosylation factor-like protein 14 n=1 Tax=Dromaius novaehollandiae TaxID=8790 RepID=A0A8C4IZ97_DRONO
MGNISSNISAFQSLHIVMLGLDSAGKTTVLYRLKFNEFVNTVPTIGFNTEKIRLSNGTAKGISCHFWDVGGQEKLRPLWKSYSRCTDGIIYVVDSVDVDRLEEAKTELHKVTKFAENQGTPLLVIANKQDLPKSLLFPPPPGEDKLGHRGRKMTCSGSFCTLAARPGQVCHVAALCSVSL